MKKSFALASLLCNSAIVLIVSAIIAPTVMGGIPLSNLSGVEALRSFTIDSNILLAFAAAVMIPFSFAAYRKPGRFIPTKILQFKHLATVGTTLTLLVSLCYLGPTQGFSFAVGGSFAFLHVIVPLLGLVSFCLCERGVPFSGKASLFALVPLLLYDIVYFVMVCVTGAWPDLYALSDHAVIAACVFLVVQVLLCLGLWVPHKLLNWKNRPERPL